VNPIKQYLQAAERNAHERYLSADGFLDQNNQFAGGEDYFNADAAPAAAAPAPAAKRSQPYIIQVSNASAAAVSNFDILGAFTYLQNTGFSSGSLTISGVTISSSLSNVTYQAFLYQSMNAPFKVGATALESLSGSSAQITEPITLTTQDANGNYASMVMTPWVDPYQQQTDRVILSEEYSIDGYTKLTISTIRASVVFRIRFFPADTINIARGLAGRNPSQQLGNPSLVRNQTVVVKG
jgi:hypothetical protein